MSYDLSLVDPVTRSVTSSTRLSYNYGPLFEKVLGEQGLRTIYGKTGAETFPLLKEAAEKLGDETDPDYWVPAPGNVKRALLQLAALAESKPEGIWQSN